MQAWRQRLQIFRIMVNLQDAQSNDHCAATLSNAGRSDACLDLDPFKIYFNQQLSSDVKTI